MNRRNFIQLTGVSLASLHISDFVKAEGKKNHIIQMPDEVNILSGDVYFSLQTSDHYTWKYKDVVVQVKKLNDSISVFVQSPTLALKEVQLS